MKNVIIISNAGSSSFKLGLLRWPTGRPIGQVSIDRIGQRADVIVEVNGRRRRQQSPVATVLEAARLAGHLLESIGVVRARVRGVVHRVVVADQHRQPVRLTTAVEQAIARAAERAPLHNPAALASIRYWRRRFPTARQVAAFDTGWFARLSPRAKTYAVDFRLIERFGLQRSGFHGFSHAAAARYAANRLHRPLNSLNLITVHLGSGCSVAAVSRGRPVDTSMGFSPLEGLVMATRPGDLDSGIVLHLLRRGYNLRRLSDLLEHHSGWRGLSGVSDDFRAVLAGAGLPAADWRPARRLTVAERRRCRLAVGVFVYRIQKYLGAYAAVLGPLDAVVFTGPIGHRNAAVRKLIMRGLRLPNRPRVVAAPTGEQAAIWQAARRLLD